MTVMVIQVALARVVGALPIMLIGFAALAQTTDAPNPNATPAGPPAKEGPQTGDCMPIGVTASGEVVFPFLCKDFLERYKSADQQYKPTDQMPASAQGSDHKPAPKETPPAQEGVSGGAGERTVDKQPETAAPQPPGRAVEPVETAPSSKIDRRPREVEKKPREDDRGAPVCTHFRSYDRATETYRDFNG
ncbi:MAG: hypothetical protein JO283_02820, partial [Bradyrhizobium sp.]|nr:hypothetical protein [Bradyrhizobium sp.]